MPRIHIVLVECNQWIRFFVNIDYLRVNDILRVWNKEKKNRLSPLIIIWLLAKPIANNKYIIYFKNYFNNNKQPSCEGIMLGHILNLCFLF